MRVAVQQVINDCNYQNVSREELLDALLSTGALGLAQERAYEYAEAARAAIQSLPNSAYADALLSIPTYIVERER